MVTTNAPESTAVVVMDDQLIALERDAASASIEDLLDRHKALLYTALGEDNTRKLIEILARSTIYMLVILRRMNNNTSEHYKDLGNTLKGERDYLDAKFNGLDARATQLSKQIIEAQSTHSEDLRVLREEMSARMDAILNQVQRRAS
jgi:hypothetical protein